MMRKSGARANLPVIAFYPGAPSAILGCVKHKSYIAQWRAFRGLKQREVIEKLIEIAANDPTLKIPKTEASLSRIEQGEQNFTVALLAALALVFDVAEPGDLLSRNPFEGMAKVISLIDRLGPEQKERAADVLEAMFKRPA